MAVPREPGLTFIVLETLQVIPCEERQREQRGSGKAEGKEGLTPALVIHTPVSSTPILWLSPFPGTPVLVTSPKYLLRRQSGYSPGKRNEQLLSTNPAR